MLLTILPLTIFYFLIRLNWLKQLQTTILLRSPMIYMALPPLKYMLFRKWWVWDNSYFLPNPEDLMRE